MMVLRFVPQDRPTISVAYTEDGPVVTLTCEQNGNRIDAKFYDELAGGREIESAVRQPSGDYQIIFTPENETNVTCGMNSTGKSDPLPIVGESSHCTARTLHVAS